jgi:hypothetical protein
MLERKFLITAKCDIRGELTPEEEQELWNDFARELVDERAFGFIASPITIEGIEEPEKGALGLRRQYRGPGGKGQRQCD